MCSPWRGAHYKSRTNKEGIYSCCCCCWWWFQHVMLHCFSFPLHLTNTRWFFTPVPRNTLSCCCRRRFRPRDRDKLVCLIAMHRKSVGLASRAVLCTSIAFDRCKALLHSRPDSTAYCIKNIYTDLFDVEKISNIASVH